MSSTTKWGLVLSLALAGLWLQGSPAPAASGNPGSPSSIAANGYYTDDQRSAHRTVSVADTTTLTSANLATLASFVVAGRPNLVLSVRSSVAAQTVKIRVAYVNKVNTTYHLLGRSPEFTVTTDGGGGQTDPNGKFVSDDITLDTRGATHLAILLTQAPASGSVDFWSGSN